MSKLLFTGATKNKQVQIVPGKRVRVVVRRVEFFTGQYGKRASVHVAKLATPRKSWGVVYLNVKAGKVLRRLKGATVEFTRISAKAGVSCRLVKRATATGA